MTVSVRRLAVGVTWRTGHLGNPKADLSGGFRNQESYLSYRHLRSMNCTCMLEPKELRWASIVVGDARTPSSSLMKVSLSRDCLTAVIL